MKRSTWQGQTRVYRYGCPSWAVLPESATNQLLLAHRLRNDLVAVEYRFKDMYDGVWLLSGPVARCRAELDAATAACEKVVAGARVDRIVDQSTVVRAARKAELVAARAVRREAKAALVAAKAEQKTSVLPLLQELTASRFAALRQVRADAVIAGLFWGSANDVSQCHDTAAKALRAGWKAGLPSQRRFRRWDGTGTLYTQIMWQAGKPERTPAVLASPTSPWRNVLRLDVGRTRAVANTKPLRWHNQRPTPAILQRHMTMYLRVEKGADPIALPVVIHRPIPDDAQVTEVRLTRRRIGSQYRLSVAITVQLPAPPPKTAGDTVAVRLGWTSVGKDRWVRVARLSTPAGPLPPPPREIDELVQVCDGVSEVYASPGWRDVHEHAAGIRTVRDQAVDKLRILVVEALEAGVVVSRPPRRGEDGQQRITAGEVKLWRSFARFVVLARAWPAEHALAAELEAWRVRDRHLWDYEAHERDQVIARRRDAWRKIADWVCTHAHTLVMSDVDVAELRQTPPVDVEDEYAARGARQLIQFAAPGELRSALVQAADKAGIAVIYPTTVTEEEEEEEL